MNKNNFSLCNNNEKKVAFIGCLGPTGPTGSTGPQGPTGSTPTIDSILVDNDGTQVVQTNSLVDLGELINSTGTSLVYNPSNTITLAPGTYYILYVCLVSNAPGQTGDVGASLIVNGTAVNNASEYVPATTTQTQIALQHNLTVTSFTTISIKNVSSAANNFHDSSLSIIKLGG